MVFGAEHRRLYAAGMQLLDTCARNKAYGLMAEADVRARGAECVETTNQNSSDLMVFAAYVQAEYAGLRRQWPRVSHQRLMQTLANKWRRLPKSAKRAHQASEATPPRPRRRT